MSSRCVYGDPGSGKSYFATMLMVEDYLENHRTIVTNVRLLPENWNAYLRREGKPEILNVERQFRLLEFHEVPHFWRFRSTDRATDHPEISAEDIKAGKRPDDAHYSSGGVLYVLDELQRHLNSRQWQSTGPLILDYITMHRHYGDDVIWMSQDPQNVDKQWRSVTADWTHIRNYGKEVMRGVKKGDYMEWRRFLDFAPKGEGKVVQASGQITIDPEGIGSLYKTSAVGGKADKGRKLKGVHRYWLYGGAAVIVLALMAGAVWGPRIVGKHFAAKRPEIRTPYMEQLGKRPMERGLESGAPLDTPNLAAASPTPRELHIVAVPLQNWTASEFLNTETDKRPLPDGIEAWPNGANNAVVVSGSEFQAVAAFAELTRQYDAQSRLVTVYAVIGRVVKGKGQRLGLYDLLYSVSRSSAGSNSGIADLLESAAFDFSLGVVTFGSALAAREVLQAVTEFQSSEYRFDVLSKPSITVVAGTSGTFTTGREIPVPVTTRDATGSSSSVQYKKADFRFTVRPTLLGGSEGCRVEVDQEHSDVIGNAQVGGDAVPTLSTQSIKTTIDLRSGDIGFLGGMIIRSDSADRRGLPLFGKLPLVNLVFGSSAKSAEESELVLLLSVVVHGHGENAVQVRRAIPVSNNFRATTDQLSPPPNGRENKGHGVPLKQKKSK